MHDPLTATQAVTVIIPHLKNRSLLESCLESLRMTTYPDFTILIVDNGGDFSDTAGIETIYPEITLLRLPSNAGYAGGCNEGLKRAVSEYVVFLNDDTVVEPQWLDHLLREAGRHERIGALQPKILSLPEGREGRRIFDYAGAAGGLLDRLGYPFCLGRSFSGREEDRGQYDEAQEIFWASGVALFAPRQVLEEMGGFEAGFFMHMEEIDLCWRMRIAGYSIRSVPQSVVWHVGGASLQEGSPMKVYLNHRNGMAMLIRNRRAVSLSFVLPVRLFLEAAAAVYYITGGSDGLAKARQVLRAALDNLRGLGETLRKRGEIQRTRRKSERELFHGAPLTMFLMRRMP
jgi:hypothetical protein